MSFMALYAIQARWDEALKHADQAVRLHREVLDHKLPYVSECQQCKLVKHEEGWSAWQDVFQVPRGRPGHAATAQASVEWVLNSKAANLELLSERVRLTRGQKDAVVLRQLDRLGQVREQMSRAGYLGASDPDRIDRLVAEEKELTRLLGRHAFRDGRRTAWAKLEDVRAAVPKDAVLLELIKVPCKDLRTRKEEDARYLAWVIPRKGEGEARFFDLGPSLEIDDAVKQSALAFVDAPAKVINLGEARAEADARARLAKLRGLVLPAAVLKELEKKKLWLVSPDSALWMVPWQALPDARGEYAVMKHDVRLLTSGRDLVRPAPRLAGGPAVIFGDPDFDSSLGRTVAGTPRRAYERDAGPRGVPLLSADMASMAWGRLRGARREVATIPPLVRKAAGRAPLAYVGDRATEAVFKALRQPRMVVFCTHGIYLPPPGRHGGEAAVPAGEAALLLVVPSGARVWVGGEEKRERLLSFPMPPEKSFLPRSVKIVLGTGATYLKSHLLKKGKVERIVFGAKDSPRRRTFLENPLIRCGLILAGANNRHLVASEADDGILTGLEIVGTDLDGTELVVLSACETGAGDVRNAEGIAGLRQAFQLAGARRVVASLWRVPDDETASLMPRFWASLAEGKDSAEALCAGQRAFILDRRKKEEGAHPYYWAAFSVTGR